MAQVCPAYIYNTTIPYTKVHQLQQNRITIVITEVFKTKQKKMMSHLKTELRVKKN